VDLLSFSPDSLLVVGKAGDTIPAPAVGSRAGFFVGEVGPPIAALAVVLPHRSPLTLAQVRPLRFPGNLLFARLFESHAFGGPGVLSFQHTDEWLLTHSRYAEVDLRTLSKVG
jgi:hypothetical protein